jgi:hypothetical protein
VEEILSVAMCDPVCLVVANRTAFQELSGAVEAGFAVLPWRDPQAAAEFERAVTEVRPVEPRGLMAFRRPQIIGELTQRELRGPMRRTVRRQSRRDSGPRHHPDHRDELRFDARKAGLLD